MLQCKNFKYYLFALLVSMVPLSTFAADTITGDVKEVVNDTGKTIEKAADAVGDAVSDAGDYVADSAITAQVKAKLAAEKDIPFKIKVTTADGVVHLDGNVDTMLQANRAVELASSVRGVKNVDDSKLTVTSSESYFNDAMLTAKVKGRLMQLSSDNKIGSAYDLHVETTNGIVHIFGSVPQRADINAIKDSVKKMEDVKGIKTNIDVVKSSN